LRPGGNAAPPAKGPPPFFALLRGGLPARRCLLRRHPTIPRRGMV